MWQVPPPGCLSDLNMASSSGEHGRRGHTSENLVLDVTAIPLVRFTGHAGPRPCLTRPPAPRPCSVPNQVLSWQKLKTLLGVGRA